jgi:hypothetical protein
MEILKFNENIAPSDRMFFEFKGKDIRQMVVDSYNSKGYKLYYYSDFKLTEITTVKNIKWKKEWGEFIFFLNQNEYDNAMSVINKSKELYDAYMKQIENVKQMPLSHIYHDTLK